MSWIIAPPYAYACALSSSSGVALGNRFKSTGTMLSFHAASIIASCVRTE